MYGQNESTYQDWVAQEWAGGDAKPVIDSTPHWTKDEWVGDQGHGQPRHQNAAQMPEGDRGMSGFRHTAPAAHWASAD
jgi:hypothetical protein